jgi:hypothetical protein
MNKPIVIKTRSRAPFALVHVMYGVNGCLAAASLEGYAYSKDERVRARAARMSAVILPIADGRVVVPFDQVKSDRAVRGAELMERHKRGEA